MKALLVGDVFGSLGVKAAETYIRDIREREEIDIVVANAENAAPRGAGINKSAASALFNAGADIITLGNHAFKDYEVYGMLKEHERIIRPANYPNGVPGKGAAICYTGRGAVGVVNLLGRLYLEACDCPFTAAEQEIAKLREKTVMIIIDMHAEATSEKRALAYCVDGRCSLVAGTHTHVQTADEQILPGGTAFITDVGMTGPADGVIGVKREIAIRRFRTLLPERYVPAEGNAQINAVIVDIDETSGKALAINRVNEIINEGFF